MLASLTFFSCISSSPSLAQGSPITDAYRQLRLLSSSTEAGVSYRSYGEQWGKTVGFVDIAIEDSDPSPFTQKLESIKLKYSDISEFWNCRFPNIRITTAIEFCLTSGFKERNPDTLLFLQQQVSINSYRDMEWVTPAVVPVLFKKASDEVKELGQILKKK